MNARIAVTILAGAARLNGELTVPEDAPLVVAFAHGSGSGRHSPRNQQVAATLQEAGLGTLLFDLLDPGEEAEDARSGKLRFDIPLLAERLVEAVDWLDREPATSSLPVGLFGASTGAAAALIAAARRPERVTAVVSRGGRPDLAGDAFASVSAPTLLIVGGQDRLVIDLNREAQERMRCETRLVIVPDAGHLFEESGALERVAELAQNWFMGGPSPS